MRWREQHKGRISFSKRNLSARSQLSVLWIDFNRDLAGTGARSADVIIEAIFENAEAKISVFSEMEKVAKPDAILATNTSSIPLETISAALKKTRPAGRAALF